MKKFRNKYRTESTRLPGWDYRNSGAYFITICTQNREHFFGDCQNGKMILTTAGMIVQGCWYQIPFLNSRVALGAFVVMPNHVHGILILNDQNNKNHNNGNHNNVEAFESNASTLLSNESTLPSNESPLLSNESTLSSTESKFQSNEKKLPSNKSSISSNKSSIQSNASSIPPSSTKSSIPSLSNTTNKNEYFQNISPKSGSVSRIVQQYKTVCTKHIRLACPEINFEWQSRFYDHIIRNENSFQNISNYIINNPKNWNKDKFFKN